MAKIIISLFDHYGNWSKPYRDNGFEVKQVDIKNGIDIMTWDYQKEFCEVVAKNPSGIDLQKNCFVVGVLAAVPCTDFALTSAASFAKKDANGTTDESIKLAEKTLEIIRYFGNCHCGGCPKKPEYENMTKEEVNTFNSKRKQERRKRFPF